MQLYNYSKSLQLSDYYKKYGHAFLETNEFIHRWGGSVPFKLMDNRICADSLLTRKIITEHLNQMFTIDSVSDEIHHKILTLYFEALIEFCIIPADTDFKAHFQFDSDKVRIFKKGLLNFRRPDTLKYPAIYEQAHSVDRVIFNKAIFVNEDGQYNLYTVMSNYGSGHIDNEFMKFSYYVLDDMFYFNAPKSSGQHPVVVKVPVSEIDNYCHQFKQLIKQKLFVSFYEKISRIVFRKVLNFDSFNENHLKVLIMLEGVQIKTFMAFMEENDFINDIFLMNDDEIFELYTVSLTTFEMMKI